jgi:hypothetical protein
VIADDYVDKAFGTGVVKVTPAHDANDYAVGQRHKLPMIGVLTLDAKPSTSNAPAAYQGMDRFVARKAVVADLEALGLLVEVQEAQAHGAALRPHRPDDRAHADRPVVCFHDQVSPLARPDRQEHRAKGHQTLSQSGKWRGSLCPRTGSTPTTSG